MLSTDVLLQNDHVTAFVTVVSAMQNNVYIIQCNRTKRAILIDAASEGPDLVALAQHLGVTQVLQTHNHWDHIGAIEDVRTAGIPVAVREPDRLGLAGYDRLIQDGDVIEEGNVRLTAIATPGHTPGSTCYALEGTNLLFTGDTLFRDGPGATHFPGGDLQAILLSIRQRLIAAYPPDTMVLPGHGPDTTLQHEESVLNEHFGPFTPANSAP